MGEGKAYSPVGRVMDRIARESRWSVRGPYRVADFVRERTGAKKPARNTWSDYFNGKTDPPPEAMRLFVRAFECSKKEVMALGYARAFREGTAA